MIDAAILSNKVIGLAAGLRKKLGPGLFKKTYIRCLAYELKKLGYRVEEEVILNETVSGNVALKAKPIDILVENTVVLDLRNEEKLLPHHEVELLTTLRSTDKKVGILINFNQPRLHEGIKKIKIW